MTMWNHGHRVLPANSAEEISDVYLTNGSLPQLSQRRFCRSLHAEPHCPGNVASLRLRLVQRSQIIVPVTINHSGPYDFLVDTGAQVTIVDPALAAELHLKIEGTTGFVGVGFRTRPSFAHLDILEAGSHAVANPLVVVQNLGNLHTADPQIRGILGGNFLGHFDVLIDYAHSMLCLDDAKVMQPEMKGKHIALVTPPHPDDGVMLTEPLIISVHLSGIPARPVLQLLDSGTNVPLLYDSGKRHGGRFLRKSRQYATAVRTEQNASLPSCRLRICRSAL